MKFTIKKLFRRSKRKTSADTTEFNYDRDPGYPSTNPQAQQQHNQAYTHNRGPAGHNGRGNNGYHNGSMARSYGFAPWFELPAPILQRIFAFVCPHSQDETYETNEQSAIEDSCMLCDLRDLAHAGMVSKSWRKAAVPVLYHSIRIDTVHYCEREIALSDNRKRRSRFDRNGIPEDTATARLHLLCRTVREDPTRLGKLVQYLKTPYMVRESHTALLARTIAVLPNLHYVDLPEGLFVDDPSYATLKLEVQARCPDLRKMTYMGGSERSLETLASGSFWLNLEVLELGKINMDPQVLRHVLAALQRLRALKVTESRVVDDDIFKHNDVLPAVPALEELILKETPRVTSSGLIAYLSRADTQGRLKVLSLTDTGVHPQTLADVLANAPNLQALSIIDQVDTAFPAATSSILPLANFSVQTLRYEITASPTVSPYAGMTQGYYNYLASSLFAGGFPRLTALYVRDLNFPDLLLGLPPPMPGFAGGSPQRPSSSNSMGMFSTHSGGSLSPHSTGGYSANGFGSNNPFASPTRPTGPSGNGLGPSMLTLNQTLEVFTKGEDDTDWGIITMDPFDNPGFSGGNGAGKGTRHERGDSLSMGNRPLSAYGLADMGAGWREGGARKSVMVGNGTGGFLSVPGEGTATVRRGSHGAARSVGGSSGVDEWPRPMSSKGDKGKDLWR